MSVVRNLMVRAGADFSKMTQAMQKAQQEVQGFSANIKNTMGMVAAALASVGIGVGLKEMVNDAIKVEGALQSLSIILGNNANDFMQWADTSAGAFNMSKVEAIDFGRTYANIVSNFSTDTRDAMVKTQDLLKASAVIASTSGRSMTDVMDRIRSGMLGNTESIEDLGIFVNVAMIESTESFKKFANGRSWLQLDFQTQNLIRYFAVLEQTARKFGTEVADNTGSNILKFQSSLGNLKLALGEAFLPILNIALPALTKLVQRLILAGEYLRAFMRALFGQKKDPAKTMETQAKATSGVASAMGDTAKATQKAAKAQKGFLAGFDEINAVAGQDGGSDGADAVANAMAEAGGAMELADVSDGNNSIVEEMDNITASAEALAAKVKPVWESISGFFKEHADKIKAVLVGINMLLPTNRMILLTYFYNTNADFKKFVDTMANGLKTFKNKVIDPISSMLGSAFSNGVENIKTSADWLMDNVLTPLGAFLTSWSEDVVAPVARVIGDVLGTAFKTVADIAKSFWDTVLKPLADDLEQIFKPAVEAVSSAVKYLWDEAFEPLSTNIRKDLLETFSKLSSGLETIYNEVLKPMGNYISTELKNTFETVFKGIADRIEGVKTTLKGVVEFLTGVFTGNWKKAWEGLKDVVKGIFENLSAIVKTPINVMIDAINTAIKTINKLEISIPDWIPGIGGKKLDFDFAEIPKLAQGGIVSSPTLAMVGEAGPEMVVPLEDTSFVDALASSVGNAVLAAVQTNPGQTMGGRDVVIQIDGNTIARALQPYTSRESTRVGASLITVR